ncbi:hypothetical protein HU200_028605 [Digitaria exilis]|uniref:Phytocyanin domain-containing protein n=1 Tax=Digitaria exilis TaxID=1010633 RepID=A0A835C5V9_9POAL|nr:hypothetical protein HU200_028605 [Digitaria exilis]
MAALLGTAHGASYTVGAPARSWGPGTNYTGWASGVTFHAGDQLVFKYTRGAQDVLEVSRMDYDACSGWAGFRCATLTSFSSGDDAVALPAGGVTRYFICGVPGHCDAGMKLAVRVEAGRGGAPNAAAPSSPAPVAAVAPRAASSGPAMSSSTSAAAVQSLVGFSLAALVAGLVALF